MIAFILNLSLGPPLKYVIYCRQLAKLALYDSIESLIMHSGKCRHVLPKLLIFTFYDCQHMVIPTLHKNMHVFVGSSL